MSRQSIVTLYGLLRVLKPFQDRMVRVRGNDDLISLRKVKVKDLMEKVIELGGGWEIHPPTSTISGWVIYKP